MKKHFVIILFAGLAIGCGNTETKSSEISKSEPAVAETPKKTASPCDLLSEADLKEQFSLPDSAVAGIEEVVRTYPTCIYQWENIIVPKKQMVSGKQLTLDYPSEISLVFVSNANEDMFGKSVKAYKDGEQVDGIGDMAMWGNQMSQLTFLANGNLMHLHVGMDADPAINRENAIVLAKKIIGRL